MHRLPTLRLRLAELSSLRTEYEATNKRHLLTYIDHLIADVGCEVSAIERANPTPLK